MSKGEYLAETTIWLHMEEYVKGGSGICPYLTLTVLMDGIKSSGENYVLNSFKIEGDGVQARWYYVALYVFELGKGSTKLF